MLVIDDEPVVRDGVRRILEAEGLRVAAVADGAEALRHPALAVCRLVICDLILPGGDGTDLIGALRGVRPGLPVVLITGYATSEHAARALRSGADDFLAKPFEESELLEVVRRILGERPSAAQETEP